MPIMYTTPDFCYPGAILLTEVELSAPVFLLETWGGAIIKGIPLSDYNAFLTGETTIDLIGKVTCRLVEIPGKNGSILVGHSEEGQQMSLVIHTEIDDWADDEDPIDKLEDQVSALLELFNPGKGTAELVLEEHPNMKFIVLQNEQLEITTSLNTATIRIGLDILKN